MLYMYAQHFQQRRVFQYGSNGYGCRSYSWPAEQGKYSRLKIWSPETGSDAHPALARSFSTRRRLKMVLPLYPTASISTVNRHWVSSEFIRSRYRVPVVYCRELTGTGPIVLKIIRAMGAAFFPGITMFQLMRVSLLFSQTHHFEQIIVFLDSSQNPYMVPPTFKYQFQIPIYKSRSHFPPISLQLLILHNIYCSLPAFC